MALTLAPGHIHILSAQHGKPHSGGSQRFPPPAMSSADGQSSVELLEGSFLTGPYTWAKNFLLDLGPTWDPRTLQVTGVCVWAWGGMDPQGHREGPGPPPQLPRSRASLSVSPAAFQGQF